MRAAFYTLGCKVNQNETSALQELFRAQGYSIVEASSPADVFVVNSCTVTQAGSTKSRKALRKAQQLNPDVVTVLTGCWPQAFFEEASAAGADVTAGTTQRARLPQLVEQFLQSGEKVVSFVPHTKDEVFEELVAVPARTRAVVKVQDGCNRSCAYCIIPKARGPARSRSEESILQELEQLGAQGYKEVVLSGINLCSYDGSGQNSLATLCQKAGKVDGISRIRLSSLEPELITEAVVAKFASTPQLCPQFHLSLQSGSNTVLRRMRRPYTTEIFSTVAKSLRSAIPLATITADIIVGFPGESDAEFLETLEFVRQMDFLKVHVFPFSAREGTAAASFEGQLPKAEKSRRAQALQKAADEVRAQVISGFLGRRCEVLLETALPNGLHTGYTENYIPVALDAKGAAQGDIVSAELCEFEGDVCRAVL